MSGAEPANLIAAETAIRRAVDEFTRAYNAGDFANLTNIFAEDLIDMSMGGPTRRGEDARRHFVSRVRETHANFRPHLEIHIDEIQIAGDWAFEYGSLQVTLTPRVSGEKSFVRQRYLVIWRTSAMTNGRSPSKWTTPQSLRHSVFPSRFLIL